LLDAESANPIWLLIQPAKSITNFRIKLTIVGVISPDRLNRRIDELSSQTMNRLAVQ